MLRTAVGRVVYELTGLAAYYMGRARGAERERSFPTRRSTEAYGPCPHTRKVYCRPV